MALDLICKKVEGQADVQSETQTQEKQEPVITCKSCNAVVTKPAFQIEIAQGFVHTFANPHGHVFEIGCFSKAAGCVRGSVPSDEFSWFKGYVWAVGVCRNCQAQLGWIFSSAGRATPNQFFGLILDQLIFP